MKRAVYALLLACILLASPCLCAHGETTADDMIAKGDQFLASGQTDKALMCYDMATKLSPENIEAYRRMYTTCASIGDAVACGDCAQRAVSALPASYEAYCMRCDAYLMVNDALNAWKDLQIALLCDEEAQPGELAARTGNALFARGDIEAALEAYALAGDSACTAPYARGYRIALTRTGQWERVVALGLQRVRTRDEQLRGMMDAPGSLRLERAAQFAIDLSDCPVYMSEEFAREHWDELSAFVGEPLCAIDGRVQIGTFRQVFQQDEETPELIEISPDGTYIFRTSNNLFVYRENALTMVVPVSSRGVPDVYGNLLYMADRQAKYILTGAVGFIWSPDGRWAALTNGKEVMRTNRMRHDLILLDAHTGEMILAETSPEGFTEGSAVLHACFDDTGERLYYVNFSSVGDSYYNISVCEMASLTTRKLFDIGVRNKYDYAVPSALFMDSDGALVNPWYSYKSHFYSLLLCRQSGGDWTLTLYDMPIMGGEIFRFQRMQLSNNSGFGIIQGFFNEHSNKHNERKSGVIVFNTDDDYAGITSQIFFSLDAREAMRGDFMQRMDAETYIAPLPAQADNFVTCAMSPDGYHALILFTMPDKSMRYGLLDLETLALRPVSAPEETCSIFAAYDTGIPDRGIAWMEDNTLLIRTEEGYYAYRLVVD